jgi:hypothetical protein
MRDFQFWLYIIVGGIYVLSRFLKKSRQKAGDQAEMDPEKPARRFDPPTAKPQPSPSKMMTFEELLKEITESKAPPKPQPEAQYTNYDEDIAEEEQDLEDVNYDYNRDKVALAYEDSKQHAFERPSLEETMNVSDINTRFEKFKVFDQAAQGNVMDRYFTDFYDPEGLKKAIVMSEILQRKF